MELDFSFHWNDFVMATTWNSFKLNLIIMKSVCKAFIIMLCLIIISSCNPEVESKNHETKSDQIIGIWDSKFMYVIQETVDGSTTSRILNVTPQDYEQVLGLQTARAYFNEDESYFRAYIGLDGNEIKSDSGKWAVTGDTITISQFDPSGNMKIIKYHLEIRGDTAIFNSLMDYDGDGEEDDTFRGTSVRVYPQKE